MGKALRLWVFAWALATCAKPPAPSRLAGLARTRLVAGPRAVALLRDMHGGRFAPPQAVVAEYGGGQLTLYVAMFASGSEAERSLAAMRRALGRSGSFSEPRLLFQDPNRFLTVGPGGHHLFWRAENRVFWLAGNPDRVFAATSELPPPAPGLRI
ncbi:MAG: hypothetical protein ACP5NF_07275 [Thermoanaerobaculum sp.]